VVQSVETDASIIRSNASSRCRIAAAVDLSKYLLHLFPLQILRDTMGRRLNGTAMIAWLWSDAGIDNGEVWKNEWMAASRRLRSRSRCAGPPRDGEEVMHQLCGQVGYPHRGSLQAHASSSAKPWPRTRRANRRRMP